MTRFLALLVIALLSGCATNQLYYWGDYQNQMYESARFPGSSRPEEQLAQLQQGVEQATERGLSIAPGIYAHMGYLQALLEQPQAAILAFQQEKLLFPEAKPFMDQLIQRIKQGPTQ